MWELDFDKVLLLRIPFDEAVSFDKSALFKLFLRRYISEICVNLIRFKSSLTYLDFKKIIELCQKEATKCNFELFVSNALSNYIANKEMHLEIRSRLGIELKAKDEKLLIHFKKYSSTVNSLMARKLRDKQMWDSFFMYTMKKSANFSVPGSGKTSSVLGVYAYLKHTENINRVVVVCPKNAFGSWIDEFSVCFEGIEQLRVLNIHSHQYKNQAQRRSALQFHSGSCNLILVNYEAVGGVVDILGDIIDASTLLVFDEVHKVKRINGEYATNSVRLAQKAYYAIAMTGTPIPNSYTDIYNLLNILYPDEYDEFFNFTIPMLRNPTSNEIQEINNKLQPFFCRTTKDQLGVPPANADKLCDIVASNSESRLLQILKTKYKNNKLAFLIRILQLESCPRMLLNALDLSEFEYLLDDSVDISKIDYADYSDEVKNLIESIPTSTKFTKCINLTASLVKQGKPVIVWCMFVDSIKRIEQTLCTMGIRCKCIYGEVELDDRQQIITDFKSGELQVLLTNPHTLAESVSLHNICHDAIYFEYSYNLVHLLQSKDRIHRLGLSENQYTQYYYMQTYYSTDDGNWSMDRAVYDRLKEKEQIMLDAIDNNILEIMPTSNDDLDIIFGKLK